MSERSAVHSTFTLERQYRANPARVFAAWADPAAKARWFGAAAGEHSLEFRVGGRELTRGEHDGTVMTFDSVYHDIVPDARIVYASTMSAGEMITTISLTTIEFAAEGEGTRLRLVEQGTFLDGHEKPEWREHGTGEWLDKLGPEVDG